MIRRHDFRPFAPGSRRAVAAIVAVFALFSVASVAISTWATSRAKHRGAVVEVATRQRMLAERYVADVLLVRAGQRADPAGTARALRESARALLDGGTAPPVDGDDDESHLVAASGDGRAQLEEVRRLIDDLTATGAAILAHRPLASVHLQANERIATTDPILRLRILAALEANASLRASRSIAAASDAHVDAIVRMQILLGVAGFVISLLLGTALTRATRRQTAHFRSLVAASTDLVLVLGEGGCRYVSRAVTQMLGRRESDFLTDGFLQFVHPDDRALVERAAAGGGGPEIVFRMLNRLGEWRHVEAHVSDLRDDVHVRGTVLNGRDVSERVRLEAELASHAFRDGLTGLANRALARDRIDRSLVRAATTGRPLALLVVDLDGLGAVNDEHGHEAGDELLRHAADRLVEALPASDTIARLDQDEFAILRDEADEEAAIALARDVLDTLAQPFLLAGREHATGASVGIAVQRDASLSGEDLLRRAATALDAARAAGRGRVELYTRGMGRVHGRTLGLEHELRAALERDELTVVYQPEIAIATGAAAAVEALVRWRTPERGVVAPSQFVPVAEAAGLIAALGHVVLRKACAQTAAWWRDGTVDDAFTTWVNVSGRQLAAGGLHALVASVLDDTGLPPAMLGLEVTETALVAANASRRARGELERLRADGVRLAIDDFGTGFSSLALLRTYPVDVLKVDGSFVAGVADDRVDAALTANVVSLAHALGLVAVGEGVESDAQLERLRALGCDLAQGFLLARPARADVTAALLRTLRGGGTSHAA